jgi:hypothetical protein
VVWRQGNIGDAIIGIAMESTRPIQAAIAELHHVEEAMDARLKHLEDLAY